MNVCDAIMNAGRRRHFDCDDKSQWDTWICWERDSTPLGDSIVSLAKMVVYFCIGGTHFDQTDWGWLFWEKKKGIASYLLDTKVFTGY